MRYASFAILGLFSLAACTPVDTPTEGFGDSVRQNMEAQIIAPQPHTAVGVPSDEFDGSRAIGVMQRYHDGKVYRPVTPNVGQGSNATPGGGN